MTTLSRLLPLSVLLAAGLLAAAPASAPAAAGPAAPAAKVPAAGIAASIVRTSVAGIDVVAYRTGVHDVVTLRGSLPAGDVFCPPDNAALATLTGMLLDKGTASRDKFAIAAELEAVGAELRFSVGSVTTEFSGKCLAKDLPRLVSLIAEQLRTPALSADELAKAKKQLTGSVRRRLENPEACAAVAFSRAVFPVGHPNREASVEEMLAGIEKTTVEDVRAFHAAHYGPARLVIVGVGDLAPSALQSEVARAFAGWSGGRTVPPVPAALPLVSATETRHELADKPSVCIALGQATGLRYGDPDTLALRVGTAILGSGFTGRLMSTVRDKEGLTYGIYASVSDDAFSDGQWILGATFSPANLDKGIASSRRELQLWYDKGVSADELERRKSNLAGAFKVGLSTTTGMAAQILITIDRGYPLSWLDEYPRRLEALTQEQVNAAIRRHLDPARMALGLAGSLPKQN